MKEQLLTLHEWGPRFHLRHLKRKTATKIPKIVMWIGELNMAQWLTALTLEMQSYQPDPCWFHEPSWVPVALSSGTSGVTDCELWYTAHWGQAQQLRGMAPSEHCAPNCDTSRGVSPKATRASTSTKGVAAHMCNLGHGNNKGKEGKNLIKLFQSWVCFFRKGDWKGPLARQRLSHRLWQY